MSREDKTYQPGELVNITIRGAIVRDLGDPEDEPGETLISATYERPDSADIEYVSVNPASPAVTIERVEPAETPEQSAASFEPAWRSGLGGTFWLHRCGLVDDFGHTEDANEYGCDSCDDPNPGGWRQLYVRRADR